MEQLLSIKHIPIKVEVKVQRAELKPVEDNSGSGAPSVKVSSKQGGGLRVQANPYKVNLSENRNHDVYVPSSNTDNGFTLTYEAIAKLADNGTAQGANNEFNAQKASRSIESVLQSLPSGKNNAVSYSDGTLSINYQMSSDQPVDLPMKMTEFEFVPGSIEFIVTQMPELDIEYLGDPIYFPRSADPNYEPPLDVKA